MSDPFGELRGAGRQEGIIAPSALASTLWAAVMPVEGATALGSLGIAPNAHGCGGDEDTGKEKYLGARPHGSGRFSQAPSPSLMQVPLFVYDKGLTFPVRNLVCVPLQAPRIVSWPCPRPV